MSEEHFSKEKGPVPVDEAVVTSDAGSVTELHAGSQNLRRNLRGKEVQLFAIGGAIGTGVFINMASSLPKGGPASFLIAFLIWAGFMWCVNECFAEMVCYLPVPAPFVRFGAEWVDEALGFAMGWNFYMNMAFLVPFEIVAMNILLNFWTDKIPVAVVVVVMLLLYLVINVVSVRYFGIAEFYFSIFKVFLIFGVFSYTFVTMVGGNPEHDAYGFRYWKNPGAFVEHITTGNVGRFCGLISCMIQATFTICGPEYVSSVAAETEMPRKILPKAFKSFAWRMLIFFCGSALCMGIVIPYNDPTLAAVYSGAIAGSGTSAASPYIISMQNLGISGLASLVNAMVMTSVFSAGNGLLFSSVRALHGMALKGEAPSFLAICTKQGIPIYALLASLAISCLAFLQLGSSSGEVLTWLADLVTACQLLNYSMTAVTYLHFYASMKKQGIDRSTLPYIGRFQPYTAYIAIFGTFFMMLAQGYDLFINGGWSIKWFFLDYIMIGFFILCVAFWKVIKRTKYVKPGTADLCLGGIKEEIDAYEAMYTPRPQSKAGALFNKMFE
ncbi:general amino acid permease [Coleophoma crateriformis]|uniref:General amino acid permease n=1 Tax=Coleophoma crateriformis TaxID=565419 RepID=A0A3D8SXF1_9HELO|nr:general amino acid permease [Coleophoma crateriformis]